MNRTHSMMAAAILYSYVNNNMHFTVKIAEPN